MPSNKKAPSPVESYSLSDAQTYRRFISLFDTSDQGIILVDPDSLLPVEFNRPACELLGYTREEFKESRIPDHEFNGESQISNLDSFNDIAGHTKQVSTRFLKKTGEVRKISATLQLVNVGGHKYIHFVFEDITGSSDAIEFSEAERNIFLICNSAGSKQELIHDVLSFFKSFTGCEAVGIRLRDREDFPYFQTIGFPDQFVELERSLCAYDEDGAIFRDHKGDPVLECMCGNIIRGRFDPSKPFFTKHGSFWSANTTKLLATTTETDRQSRTRNRCNGSGYESVALIPIRHNDITYGLCQFNDKRAGWHTAEKIEKLEYLVDYVAIALAKMGADEARAENEQNFKQIFNSTTEAILIQDPDTGKILDVNDTMVKMFGFASKSEAVSKNISDISYGDHKSTGEKALSLVTKAKNEGPQTFEWQCRKFNGKPFWTEVVLNRILISGDKKIMAVVRDISDRKRMEEALYSSKEKYRLLFEEMVEGFALHEIILDDKGVPVDYRFLDINPAFEELTGLKKEMVIGHTVKEIMPGIEDYWVEKYGEIALHGDDLRYENYSKDLGKWFNVTVYCPKFGQFVTVFEDITLKKVGDLALKESEEQFRSIFEQSAVGMCIVSMDGIFLRINDSFCHTLGYSQGELIGKSVKLVTHPDDYKVTDHQLLQPVISNNENIQFEKRYINRSGQVIEAIINSTLIRDASGNPRHFITQVQDITEKKKTEEALQLRNKIFMHAQDMLFIGGFDGFFKVLNPAFENTLGWTNEELMGRPWIEFVHPDDIAKTIETNRMMVENHREIHQFENRYLCKDGKYRWLAWNSYPYPEENIIVGVARDVTERKELDVILRQSEERYKLIDEASSDSIYSYDHEGRFTHVNTALCKTLGLSSEQIIGKTHQDLGFPKEQCEEWDRLHKQVYESEKTVISETIATINGEVKYFEVVLDPIHDENKNVIGIAGTTRDIDARKKAEIKIQEQIDELRRWNAVTLGRENRIIELKKEINDLLMKMNQPPRYFKETGGDKNDN